MSEKLGEINRPEAGEFRRGRKLYYIPLLFCGEQPPEAYREKYERYWTQVEQQLSELETRLGAVTRLYHELVDQGGEPGCLSVKKLNDESYRLVKPRTERGARLEPVENADLLAEFRDWSKCLAAGLQHHKVFTAVYEAYLQAIKQRSEHIIRQIDTTLPPDEAGILLMREGHQLQFPADIQVFYIAPPALDELKRWLRDQ